MTSIVLAESIVEECTDRPVALQAIPPHTYPASSKMPSTTPRCTEVRSLFRFFPV
jgi:hypothetical protein